MANTTRTFIAVALGEPLQRFLDELIRQGQAALPGARWVDPASIHLTLAFLGELTSARLALAEAAAEAAARQVPAFSYRLSRVGIFGPARDPRVLWMGIDEPSGHLQRLNRVLWDELEQRDFERELRPFSPHLTLARIKTPFTSAELATLQKLLGSWQAPDSLLPQPVATLDLMKSELLRSGPRYTRLQALPLPASL